MTNQNKLIIGISSRALFNLEKENELFKEKGIEEYIKYQIENEDNLLEKGTGFHIINALLNLNKEFKEPIIEVIIMSKNNPETGLRMFNSIEKYNLDIKKAAFTGGESITPYLKSFKIDLFLSKYPEDVQKAIDTGIASALIHDSPKNFEPNDIVKIAFDADAVLFSEESEKIYKEKGLQAFIENEKNNSQKPLPEGPFGKILKILSTIKKNSNKKIIEIAIVTSRSNPAYKRVILTLRKWGVEVDKAFFLAGQEKKEILNSFNAHIFFDDQEIHTKPASEYIPSARVPYKSDSPINDIIRKNINY
jgi:5'-nucleotidase